MISDTHNKLFKILLNSAKQVSMGAYDQTDNLMGLTKQDKDPPEIAQLKNENKSIGVQEVII